MRLSPHTRSRLEASCPRSAAWLLPMALCMACGSDGGAGPDDGPLEAALSVVSWATPEGTPVDANDAAGVVVLNLDATTPSGFAGTLSVTVGGRELYRDAFSAGAAAAGGAAAADGGVPRAVAVDLARYSASFTGERIEAVPLTPNGSHDVVVRLDGSARGRTVSAELRTTLVVQQPDAITALLWPRGASATVGATLWRAGDLTLIPVVVPFSGSPVTEIGFLLDDRPVAFTPATTGRGALAATRSQGILQNAALAAAALPYTSPASGSRVWIDRMQYGSLVVDPQTAVQSFNGRCFDLDGDGFADAARAAGQTLPSGCTRFLQLPRLTVVLDPGAGRFIADQVFYWDNQGPSVAPHAFRLVDGTGVVGAQAMGTAPTYCCRDNWIGIDYDLRWGLDASGISDAGAGLAGAATPRFYIAPADIGLDELFMPAREVPPVPNLPTTPNSLTLIAGASIFDALGNRTDLPLTTSAMNAMSLTGTDATPGDGTRAVLGSDQHRPTFAYTGTITGFVAFTAATPGITMSGTYGDVGSGFAVNPALLRVLHNGSCLVGGGTGCLQGEVIAGDAGSSTLPFTAVRGRASGDAQGVYAGAMAVRDRAGNTAVGFDAEQFWYLWDYTAPASLPPVLPAAVNGGASQTWQIDATDNTSVLENNLGFYVDGLVDAAFGESRVHAPLGVLRGDGIAGQAQVQLGGSVSVPFVTHIAQTGPTGQPPTGSPHAVTHVFTRALDEALNRSALARTALNGTPAAPPPVTNVSSLAQGASLNTVCGAMASSCTGLETASFHTLRATTPPATGQPFAGAYLFAVGTDGFVRRLCAITTAQVSGGAPDLVHEYACTVDWTRTRADTLQLFWWAVTSTGLAWMTPFMPMYVQ